MKKILVAALTVSILGACSVVGNSVISDESLQNKAAKHLALMVTKFQSPTVNQMTLPVEASLQTQMADNIHATLLLQWALSTQMQFASKVANLSNRLNHFLQQV